MDKTEIVYKYIGLQQNRLPDRWSQRGFDFVDKVRVFLEQVVHRVTIVTQRVKHFFFFPSCKEDHFGDCFTCIRYVRFYVGANEKENF
jgi:hypothetical protein